MSPSVMSRRPKGLVLTTSTVWNLDVPRWSTSSTYEAAAAGGTQGREARVSFGCVHGDGLGNETRKRDARLECTPISRSGLPCSRPVAGAASPRAISAAVRLGREDDGRR